MNDEFEVFDNEQLPPSKSARKREMQELQTLGERLIKLSARELGLMPMNPEIAEAVAEGRRLSSSEAQRRQLRFIGKLLARDGAEPIRNALADLDSGRQQLARRFHELEHWRDQLLEQGPQAIEDVVERYPQADRQQLRSLLLAARRERERNKPPAASRKLFRYLRELDENSEH